VGGIQGLSGRNSGSKWEEVVLLSHIE